MLLVDDNVSMRAALRAIVKSDGHEVVGEAAEGKSALALFKQLKPDVVLLDLMMPGKSGLEVLAEINNTGQRTAVLVVSGIQDPSLIEQAVALGAIGSVAKPLNADRILRTIGHLRPEPPPGNGQRPAARTPAASAARCVIVDSSPAIRGFLKALLATAGIEVAAEAADGMQGLCSIEEQRPDLVFLDVDMPELDGLNVLRCLRAVHPDLRVIIATSRAEGEIVKEAVSQRVAGYLLKPFDSAKVLASVRKALGTA